MTECTGKAISRWGGLFLLAWGVMPASGYDARFYAVEVQVRAQSSPPALVFSWPATEYARQYFVRRKNAADSSWGGGPTLPGNSTGFTDGNVAPGTAYEYEIQLESTEPATGGGWINAYGYALAGINVAERDRNEKVILVVDRAISSQIAADLEIFKDDLLGAGWTVIAREVSRTDSVTDVKNVIRSEYNADPGKVRSVILIGHVPVPYSGNIAPDLHARHRGAWPADAYYADMDGTWTDNSVSVRGEDYEENDNFPGDGKFDQSLLPSATELEIGRIDFWELPAFQLKSEAELLRNYFRKNHAFRHRLFTAPRQGLVRDNFGDLDGDAPAVDAWRHFGLFFGPDRVREAGPGDFFPTLNSDGFLWAYGGGGGGNEKADGVGSTWDFAANDPRAVFLFLHGSYFGDWNHPDNFLRAAIATPSFTLASVWSGLPHWFMHHMALGSTIGYSARVTQNNRGTYKSHKNFSSGEVHISLIGDPTLEMYPVLPPSNLAASAQPDVRLSWSPSQDENIVGYHVYHSISRQGPYTRITQEAVTGTAFAHATGIGMHYYIVRAVKSERTGSGSFRNLSQGVFVAVSKTSGSISTPPTVTVATEDSDAAEFRANSGSFRFTRDIVDGNPLVVSFALGGTAQNGVDYLPVTESVTIAPWSGNVLLAIYPRSDVENEGDETVTIQLKDSSSYRIGSSASAAFNIRNTFVNQPPTATGQPLTVFQDEPEPVQLAGNDPEGANLQFTLASNPVRGTLSGTPPNLIYRPESNGVGSDSFTFVVSDGFYQSAPATVAITIHPRPLITSVLSRPAGMVIGFTGPAGLRLVVEGSTNAVNWVTLGEASPSESGQGEYLDSAVAGVALKFYRLEWNR